MYILHGYIHAYILCINTYVHSCIMEVKYRYAYIQCIGRRVTTIKCVGVLMYCLWCILYYSNVVEFNHWIMLFFKRNKMAYFLFEKHDIPFNLTISPIIELKLAAIHHQIPQYAIYRYSLTLYRYILYSLKMIWYVIR